MEEASKGALARSMKWEAIAKRHERTLLSQQGVIVGLKAAVRGLKLKVKQVFSQLREMRREKNRAEKLARARGSAPVRVEHTILVGKTETQCRSLAGVSSHEGLLVSSVAQHQGRS